MIFFAYIGFDAVSTSAQEAKNPQRDMPVGIIGSLAICTLLYVLVSGAMISLVPYKEMLNQPAPLVIAVEAAEKSAAGGALAAPMSVLRILVTLGALAGLKLQAFCGRPRKSPLPAAMAYTTPEAMEFSTASFTAWEKPPPRLMLATAVAEPWLAVTQSIPAIIWDQEPLPEQFRTRTA